MLGARRVDFLTKNQLLRMLGMVAEVKHIPRLQKDNGLMLKLQQWQIPEQKLAATKKSMAAVAADAKTDRREANALIMAADMLRCSVAANKNGATLQEDERLQMEQMAAILTRLGVHKLQKVPQKQVKAFCDSSGIAQTPEVEQ